MDQDMSMCVRENPHGSLSASLGALISPLNYSPDLENDTFIDDASSVAGLYVSSGESSSFVSLGDNMQSKASDNLLFRPANSAGGSVSNDSSSSSSFISSGNVMNSGSSGKSVARTAAHWTWNAHYQRLQPDELQHVQRLLRQQQQNACANSSNSENDAEIVEDNISPLLCAKSQSGLKRGQAALARLVAASADADAVRRKRLARLVAAFSETAVEGARRIVAGLHLLRPQSPSSSGNSNESQDIDDAAPPAASRTFGGDSPVRITRTVGGAAGGEKYYWRGIFFKVALDAGSGLWARRRRKAHGFVSGGNCAVSGDINANKETIDDVDTDSAYLIAKTLGHDFRHSALIEDQAIPGLRTPLTCCIDHAGVRFIALSMLPISHDTLMYGSSDGTRSIRDCTTDTELLSKIELLADSLSLGEELIEPARTLNTLDHRPSATNDQQFVRLRTACDVEGHRAADGRCYLVDLARFMPPTTPRGATDFLIALLRPEFLSRYAREVEGPLLVADSFSNFRLHDRLNHNDTCRRATDYLEATVVLQLAQELGTLPFALTGEDLVQRLHAAGVNLRYLGRLFAYMIASGTALQLHCVAVAREIFARSIKSVVRWHWRELVYARPTSESELIRSAFDVWHDFADVIVRTTSSPMRASRSWITITRYASQHFFDPHCSLEGLAADAQMDLLDVAFLRSLTSAGDSFVDSLCSRAFSLLGISGTELGAAGVHLIPIVRVHESAPPSVRKGPLRQRSIGQLLRKTRSDFMVEDQPQTESRQESPVPTLCFCGICAGVKNVFFSSVNTVKAQCTEPARGNGPNDISMTMSARFSLPLMIPVPRESTLDLFSSLRATRDSSGSCAYHGRLLPDLESMGYVVRCVAAALRYVHNHGISCRVLPAELLLCTDSSSQPVVKLRSHSESLYVSSAVADGGMDAFLQRDLFAMPSAQAYLATPELLRGDAPCFMPTVAGCEECGVCRAPFESEPSHAALRAADYFALGVICCQLFSCGERLPFASANAPIHVLCREILATVNVEASRARAAACLANIDCEFCPMASDSIHQVVDFVSGMIQPDPVQRLCFAERSEAGHCFSHGIFPLLRITPSEQVFAHLRGAVIAGLAARASLRT